MQQNNIVSHRIFARNLFANWVGVTAEVLVAFFLTPFIVNSLGLGLYGVWSLVNGLVGYLGLIDFGIRGSTGRFINHYIALKRPELVNEVISTSLVVVSLLSLIVILVAFLIGIYFDVLFPKTPSDILSDIVIVLPLLGINLWFAFITAILRAVVVAHDRFDIVNGVNLFGLLIKTLGVIYVLSHDYGFIGLVCAIMVTGVANLLVYAVVSHLILPTLVVGPHLVSKNRLHEIWGFGLPVFLSSAASQLIDRSDQIIIMSFFGAEGVGMYSIALLLIEKGQMILGQMQTPFIPSITKCGSLYDLSGLRLIFMRNARMMFFFGILLYIGIFEFGNFFIKLWMGSGYQDATLVLGILSLARLAALIGSTSYPTLNALNKPWLNVGLMSSFAGLNIVLTLLCVGVLDLGLAGVAIGTLIATIAIPAFLIPIVALRQIEWDYLSYLAALVPRLVAPIVGLSLLSQWVVSALPPMTWVSFFVAVGIVAACYMILAPLIMLDSDTRRHLWARFTSKLRRGHG